MARFTVDDVMLAMQAVVKEKGEDYVYPRNVCVYAEDGNPSCVVGHVIHRLDPDEFIALARAEAQSGGSLPANDLCGSEWVSTDLFDRDALQFLHNAQFLQDDGATWGFAFEKASSGVL